MSSPPRLRRTGPIDLAAPLVVVGVVVYLLLRVSYDTLPPLGYLVPAPLAALAVAEFVAARRVRAAVRHDPRARPMAALVIARCVALGKASSIVGAGVVGGAVALLARVAPEAGTVRVAAGDTRVGAALLAAAAFLVAAGLLLERAGVDPANEEKPPHVPAE
ncbi:MAG: DUF3180 family protein [Jatrophihabitantaceae bacterium]